MKGCAEQQRYFEQRNSDAQIQAAANGASSEQKPFE